MRMFNLWPQRSRGCDKAAEVHFMSGFSKPITNIIDIDLETKPQAFKRKRGVGGVALSSATSKAPSKRAKIETDGAAVAAPPVPDDARQQSTPRPDVQVLKKLARTREVIQKQFSLEILLKHNELRLIEQEMAKCQVALEQLRRCHLIPYPTACPTPQQMLDISSGKGAAVRPRPGQAVPKWAPPFGVVDGPYARHYAKWLIPDPMFDGLLPEWQGIPTVQHQKMSAEGRTTRNSFADSNVLGKHRPSRGNAGQKLHALSSGYPQPKEKAGPCILKRGDGRTVKLVCIDCHRDNFSSTQGFINHCRIAHKRDFKSHEEAAVHCGHPIEVDEPTSMVASEEKPAGLGGGSSIPGLVHPLARADPETCNALLSRIDASLKMFDDGLLPDVATIPTAIPTTAAKPASAFVGSDETPYLTRLMQGKQFTGNLRGHVEDATTKMDLDDAFSADEESEDGDQIDTPLGPSLGGVANGARTPAVMRVPSRPTMTPSTLATGPHPTSSKGRSPHLAFSLPSLPVSVGVEVVTPIYEDDEMDTDLSPNTTASNNAPSLVSDDGEYDDDDGSASEASDSDAESGSDVAEISIAEDEVQGHDETPRGIRHHRGSTGTAVKLKKDEPKHVTFVSPVRGTTKGRRKKTT